MKDMEIKTENRYEYRKTQEKRKQMIAPDLFEFAYVMQILPVRSCTLKGCMGFGHLPNSKMPCLQ